MDICYDMSETDSVILTHPVHHPRHLHLLQAIRKQLAQNRTKESRNRRGNLVRLFGRISAVHYVIWGDFCAQI